MSNHDLAVLTQRQSHRVYVPEKNAPVTAPVTAAIAWMLVVDIALLIFRGVRVQCRRG